MTAALVVTALAALLGLALLGFLTAVACDYVVGCHHRGVERIAQAERQAAIRTMLAEYGAEASVNRVLAMLAVDSAA